MSVWTLAALVIAASVAVVALVAVASMRRAARAPAQTTVVVRERPPRYGYDEWGWWRWDGWGWW